MIIILDTGQTKFHLCVCNVGDSLAYVYSDGQVTTVILILTPLETFQNYNIIDIVCQVREATLGSHDITANRDMRDALGALGPVDGLNPELSNLTCRWPSSAKHFFIITTLQHHGGLAGRHCFPHKRWNLRQLRSCGNSHRSKLPRIVNLSTNT